MAYSDEDRDAIHILPLAIIPLDTIGLRRTKLIKNARVETVVELFRDDKSGSGQIDVKSLKQNFDHSGSGFADDQNIVETLAESASFDVFSLRLTLRSHNIKVDEADHLRLSAAMQEKLTSYMRVFTRPLVQRVFGDDTQEIATAADIVNMFRAANREEALRSLRQISEALDMSIDQIPGFLEDYGDTFLSLSYFRRYLDRLRPDIEAFKRWIAEGVRESHLRNQAEVIRSCDFVEQNMDASVRFIMRRFGHFDELSRLFWIDLNPDRYAKVRQTVTNHHTTIGGMLCGLAVKMETWREEFPTGAGSPNNRVDFLNAQMVPGLDKIRALEAGVPKIDD